MRTARRDSPLDRHPRPLHRTETPLEGTWDQGQKPETHLRAVIIQSYTSCRFMIGREKNPNQSEVARLIQQSIEQDKRRAEARRRELEERQKEQEELEQLPQQMQVRKAGRELEDSMEVKGNPYF